MIVNLIKFQVIVLKKTCRMKNSYGLNINNQTINSQNCVKLFGTEIDSTLCFDQHISTFQKSKQSIKCDGKNSEVHGLSGK